MISRIVSCVASVVAMGAVSSASAAPVTKDDFMVSTAGNLVALCTASPTDPLYTPARNFCHGFAVGTYRVIAVEEAAVKRRKKMFCMPENPPSRDQAIDAFAQWVSERPKVMSDTPTDAIAEYLSAQYPCK